MAIFRAALLSLPLLLPLSLPIWADTAPTITVSGEGSVEGAPDMAVLSLGVTTQGETAADAMTANSAALSKVLDRLKSAGLDERDLQTSNLSLSPNWTGYDNGATPRIAGYTASNQLSIRVREIAKLGAVLDAAVTDGANTLNGLSFGLSDPKPALTKARVEAVKDAREKAELLAGAAGVKLGKVLTINENGGFSQPAPMFRATAAEAMPVPVQGGEVSATASVTIVFELVN